MECGKWYPGTRACTYQQLVIVGEHGDLINAIDRTGAAVTSVWAIDHTADGGDECTHANVNQQPWTYQTGDQGDRGLSVSVTRADGTIGGLTQQGCSSSRHIACCSP